MSRTASLGFLLALAAAGHAQHPPDPPAENPPTKTEPATPPPTTTPPNPLEERLRPTFSIRGRIEVDAVVAAQSAESIAAIGNLQNGYGFRRVRLGAQGAVGDAARWLSEVELAGGRVAVRDVFVGLTALPAVRELRVGHFREPFSLDGATSSNFITFLERSPLNLLDPARNWGVCGFWRPDDERAFFALGAFRTSTDNGGQSVGDRGDWAVTTRLTGLPVYEPDDDRFQLAHLGVAFSHRIPDRGVVNLSPTPQSNLLTVEDNPASPFLPPVAIPADSQQLYNLQAARVSGPFSLQAEWFGTTVRRTTGGVVFLHGFYADASYFLTGEHRGYEPGRGVFGRVSVRRPLLRSGGAPVGGCGAVEVAARFSFADFRSPNLPPAADGSPTGAVLYQLTAGVNWYLNDYTRVMFNYTAGFPDPVGRPAAAAHLFSLRTAIFW